MKIFLTGCLGDAGRCLFLEEFIASELRFLVWTILCGGLLGLTYGLLRVFRHFVKHHRFVVGIEDLFFWIFAAIVMFSVILVANNGMVRWFSVAGMTIGMIIVSTVLKYIGKGITIIVNKAGKVSDFRTWQKKR